MAEFGASARVPHGQRLHPQGTARRRHVLRVVCLSCVSVVLAFSVMASSLVGMVLLPTHLPALAPITSPRAGVKHYYLALGDSLAFGFQPDLNWFQGYTAQWWDEMQWHGSRSFVNYACNDINTTQFIHGGCPDSTIKHDAYQGPQLAAAVSFITHHPGQVSPVSLDIGANDVLADISPQTCSPGSTWTNDLEVMDDNLTAVILPELVDALTNSQHQRTGDLVMMNYYNPYQKSCPGTDEYVTQLNAHLAADAAQFGVPIVNVYAAYGGNTTPDHNTCSYTWMCGFALRDIHPTTLGYSAIAHAFEQTTGY